MSKEKEITAKPDGYIIVFGQGEVIEDFTKLPVCRVQKIKSFDREDILSSIAEAAVWAAMSICNDRGQKRCQLCENGNNPVPGQCKDDTDCMAKGFPGLESLNSASEKIKSILRKRT